MAVSLTCWEHPGSDHQRQRKIITPAFNAIQLKSFLPIFQQGAARVSFSNILVLSAVLTKAQQMTELWKSQIMTSSKSTEIMQVASWFSRVTIDILGRGVLHVLYSLCRY